ncbi:hypothetical protein [Candidatus Pyrohabitans sp.]
MPGRTFLRHLALFSGAFLLVHGLRLLSLHPEVPGAALFAMGITGVFSGLHFRFAEDNSLSHVFAAYVAAVIVAAVVVFFISGLPPLRV